MSQTSRPINNDSDSDDDSPPTRPQRRVPAFHSSSQEDSSLVVKGNQQYLYTMFLMKTTVTLCIVWCEMPYVTAWFERIK